MGLLPVPSPRLHLMETLNLSEQKMHCRQVKTICLLGMTEPNFQEATLGGQRQLSPWAR